MPAEKEADRGRAQPRKSRRDGGSLLPPSPAACHQLLTASSRAPSIVIAKPAVISRLDALLTHIGMSLLLSSSRGCEVRVQNLPASIPDPWSRAPSLVGRTSRRGESHSQH